MSSPIVGATATGQFSGSSTGSISNSGLITTTTENYAFAIIGSEKAGGAPSVTGLGGGTLVWTLYQRFANTVGDVAQEVWSAPITAPLTNEPLTVTLSANTDDSTIAVFCASDVFAAAPFDTPAGMPANGQGTTTAPLGVSGVATSQVNTLLVYASTNQNSFPDTPAPTGFTFIVNVDNGGGSLFCYTFVNGMAQATPVSGVAIVGATPASATNWVATAFAISSVGPPPPSCDPNWTDVVLLLDMDGTNGQTTFTDLSISANTVTAHGSAQVDTSDPKFGTGALHASGVDGALTTPIVSAGPLDLSTQASWTIEGWYNAPSFGNADFLYTGAFGSNGFYCEIETDSTLHFTSFGVTGGSGAGNAAGTPNVFTAGVWNHFAIVNNAGVVTVYINGLGGAPSDAITGITPWSGTLNIGGGAGSPVNGEYDEIRITAGVARYTANFTPPLAAFATMACGATVPNVVGDDDATARAAIIAAGLTVGTVTTAIDPSAAGTVLSTNPTAGTMLSTGAPVDLVESAGPATTVPNVVGLLDAAARTALTAAGLVAGTITTVNDPTPVGTVISQSPVGGTAATFGDAVALLESLGPPTGTVPDVTGLGIAAATAVLTAAGFTVGSTNSPYNNTVPRGIIFAQTPAGGSTAVLGSPVNVTISNGPEPLTVPLLIGSASADAASLLGSLLLHGAPTSAFNPIVPAGIVFSQAPAAGTPIAQGGVVAYVISFGPFIPPLITPYDFEQTVMSQFANSPTLLQLITNMAQYMDVATDFTNFFNTIWNIDTANTFGQNIWGRILGVSRVIPIPGDNDSFGFDNSDVPPDWQTWGNANDPTAGAPFFGGQLSTGSYTLDNNAYRTLLLAKALANIANMSAPSLNQLVSNLFPGRGRAYTTNGRNMTMTYVFEFALSTIELAILESSGVLPNPAGVTVGITVSP